jgi:hypothetical protein
VERRFDFHDAGLPSPAPLDMLLDDIYAFDDYSVPSDHVDAHLALLALVPARSHQDGVAAPNFSHPLALPL